MGLSDPPLRFGFNTHAQPKLTVESKCESFFFTIHHLQICKRALRIRNRFFIFIACGVWPRSRLHKLLVFEFNTSQVVDFSDFFNACIFSFFFYFLLFFHDKNFFFQIWKNISKFHHIHNRFHVEVKSKCVVIHPKEGLRHQSHGCKVIVPLIRPLTKIS